MFDDSDDDLFIVDRVAAGEVPTVNAAVLVVGCES